MVLYPSGKIQTLEEAQNNVTKELINITKHWKNIMKYLW
jgi:hypothetical protein